MSLAVRVIPCLDVDAGRVVKGINFQELRDAGDPVELAKVYDVEGADELTFLDISASHEGRSTTLEIVARTAEQVFIPLTVGGGIGSVDDAVSTWNLGTGHGTSVLEVLHAFERACGHELPYEVVGRRAGDIAASYADPSRAEVELGWKATRDIDDMCADQWRWQSDNPLGYPD